MLSHACHTWYLYHMHIATKFNSRFIKADNRQNETFVGYRALSSHAGEWICVKDIFVAPGEKATSNVKGNCLNMFLPLVGTACLNANIQRVEVLPEEVFCFGTGADTNIEISNPHRDETINLLQLSVSDSDPLFYLPPSICRLNLEELNHLANGDGFASGVHAGVFHSRTKGVMALRHAGASLLCYVINGAFEVEERLMEHRDALFIWDVDHVEFESRSENAIILFIECSPLK